MVSYKRHMAKTVSWRVIGTLDTVLLSFLITGSWETGFTIGAIEILTKMLLYFIHERAWYKLSKFGLNK